MSRRDLQDLIGLTFGSFTVIAHHDAIGENHRWECRCVCNTIRILWGSVLKRAKHQKDKRFPSCGCQKQVPVSRTHGLNGTPIFNSWFGMINRCTNPDAMAWRNYGGRGITVCRRWTGPNGLTNFLADMGHPPKGYQLERENNNGPYSPSNCYWATRKQQARNKRNNRKVTYNGRQQCATAWAEELNLPYDALIQRLAAGWSPSRAIEVPFRAHRGRSPSCPFP